MQEACLFWFKFRSEIHLLGRFPIEIKTEIRYDILIWCGYDSGTAQSRPIQSRQFSPRQFSPRHFSPTTIQSQTDQSQDISVPKCSVQKFSVPDSSVLKHFSPANSVPN